MKIQPFIKLFFLVGLLLIYSKLSAQKKYYVSNLIYEDLFVPSFIKQCREALSELTNIINFTDIYPFQKNK